MSLTTSRIAADLALRPATLDDALFVADMETAVRPQDPQDPVMTRYWWEHPWDGSIWQRDIALRDGTPAGLSVFSRPADWTVMPGRWGRVGALLIPELRTQARLEALLAFAEAGLAAAGGLRAHLWTWEDDPIKIAAAHARGFREERRERFWQLDLTAERERLQGMTAASRRRMRDAGIEILTLDRVGDPQRYEKLWRMSEEAERDIPTTVPHMPAPFDAFMSSLRAPNTREDRVWVARRGDEMVGISYLQFPPVRGAVETGWTGTARSVRGQGVARALKCETVMQAIELGVDRVQTDNDSQNKPILHINETMGYRIKGEMIQFIKELALPGGGD